jgi:uncharacterized membrane protein
MSKRIVAAVVALAFVAALGCATSQVVCVPGKDCRTYQPCGPLDPKGCEDPDVVYETSVGNVVLSILLVETIVAPVVLIGWYLWEPAGPNLSAEGPRP